MGLLFRYEAKRLEQEAKGHQKIQKIMDEAEAESARKELLELQAHRYVYTVAAVQLSTDIAISVDVENTFVNIQCSQLKTSITLEHA